MNKPLNLLLVDDSQADARLMQLWLQKSQVIGDLRVAVSGSQALGMLRREGEYASVPRPDLVLLDVNLPDMQAWDILQIVRGDPALADLAVLILTGTLADADARRAKDFHVISYLAKPFDADEFAALVREIESFAERCGMSPQPFDQ